MSLIAVLCLGLTSAAATVNLGNFEGTMDNWENAERATGPIPRLGNQWCQLSRSGFPQ